MLIVKKGGINYHILRLLYDLTWDSNLVSGAIGKHEYLKNTTLWKLVVLMKLDLLLSVKNYRQSKSWIKNAMEHWIYDNDYSQTYANK